MKDNKVIALVAGGSGGHIFPAQALAQELQKKGFQIHLLTEKRGVSFQNTEFSKVHKICAGNVGKKGLFFKLVGIFTIIVGFFQASVIFLKFKPIIIVGFGGYPSFSSLLSAIVFRFKFFIHEQNVIFGKVNRFLSRYSKKIAVSFLETKLPGGNFGNKVIVTGMPVRQKFVGIRDFRNSLYKTKSSKINLLVLGGSQGAAIFSKIVPDAISRIPFDIRKKFRVFQQCRENVLEETKEFYLSIGIDAQLSTFFYDIPFLLKTTHLVIGRAGASILAELSIVGCPAILIPYPYAKDDHQMINAKVMKKKNAAWVIPENESTAGKLANCLMRVINSPEELAYAAKCMKNSAQVKSNEKLVNLVQQMIGNVR